MASLSLDALAALSPAQRQPYIDTAAAQRDMDAVIVEKDFWVVWTLKHLLALTPPVPFIFKGGTSLSKAFNLIQRFSEDIDLIIDRRFFGYAGTTDVGAGASATAREKRRLALQERVAEYIATVLKPALQTRMDSVLAVPAQLSVDTVEPETLLFHYPTLLPPHPYIKSRVQIEMGGHADNWPSLEVGIQAYIAEALPTVIAEPPVKVQTLEAVRTLWEKLSILHKTAHRLESNPGWATPLRYSRHYYDVYQMSMANMLPQALARRDLVIAVRDAAKTFFPAGWAQYDAFTPGSIRLLPSAAGRAMLGEDYEAMQDMIFGPDPGFDVILTELEKVEAAVNQR